MALKRIKTNTQKQETKDTPHTNGKYKIRQTITKIMEYTHKTPVNKTKIVKKKKSTVDFPVSKVNIFLMIIQWK